MAEENKEFTSFAYEELKKFHPKRHPLDFLSLVSAVMIIFGIVLVFTGYGVPQEYEFDPFAPAREMEAIETYYLNLQWYMDICVTIGICLISGGSIIISSLLLLDIFRGNMDDFVNSYSNSKRDGSNKSYGSADHRDSIMLTSSDMNNSFGRTRDTNQ